MDTKRIEQLTKIKIDRTSDFVHDIEKLDQDIFKKYSQDIRHLAPLHHSSDITAKLREDKARPPLDSKEALQNAKVKKREYFVSLKTIPK